MGKLVSVIMPMYNSASTIKESVFSVLSQSYNDLELLIVDDNSSDDSLVLVNEIAKSDNRIRQLKNKLWKGAGGARQTAIDASVGSYLAFLDSDDVWHVDKLKNSISFMEKEEVDFTYSDYILFKDHVDSKNRYLYKTPSKVSYEKLLKYCPIGCLTVVLRKSIVSGVRFRNCYKEDYLFWLDILKNNTVAYRVDNSLSFYRKGKNTLSSNKLLEGYRQYVILHEYQKISTVKSLIYLLHYAYHGINKSAISFLKLLIKL